ncbi:MAG TPA: tetratricopeptide repeat protein [Flavobacterium sp.]|jgi:tetratricopeptide (TPR) repeat protein
MRPILWLLFISFPLLAQTEFEKGEKLFLSGKYAQAKPVLESYIKSHAEHLQALELLGDIHGHLKQWEQALSYYQKLKTLRPRTAAYHYKTGGVLGMIAKESSKFKAFGMISNIRDSFEKAISLDPKHIEARWALIELYLQLPGIVGGSEKKANQYANQLMELSPVDGHLAKGHIAEYFERYAEAEKSYKKAIAAGKSKTSYEKLANLYKNKMKQPEKAKALLADYKKNLQTGNS